MRYAMQRHDFDFVENVVLEKDYVKNYPPTKSWKKQLLEKFICVLNTHLGLVREWTLELGMIRMDSIRTDPKVNFYARPAILVHILLKTS